MEIRWKSNLAGSAGGAKSSQRFALSEMAFALMAVFSPAYAVAANPLSAAGITVIWGQTDGAIQNTAASGSAISATAGGLITVSNTQVSETNSGALTRGLLATGKNANGSGSSIQATNTNISVAGAGSGTNGASAAVGVQSASGGEIFLSGGTVKMTGANLAIAIRSLDGGSTNTTGIAISTVGVSSHGVQAFETNSALTALVTVNGGSVTTAGPNSYGLFAQNTGATVNDNGARITTMGDVGRGIYANAGGVVNVAGGIITTNGSYAVGMLASGVDPNNLNSLGTIIASDVTVVANGSLTAGIAAGSSDGNPADNEIGGSINFTGGSITTTGSQDVGVLAQLGGSIGLRNTSVTNTNTADTEAMGLYATGAGSSITAANTQISVAGIGNVSGPGIPIGVESGAAGVISLTDSTVAMIGNGPYEEGLYATGTGSSITATNTNIAVAGTGTASANAPVGVDVDEKGNISLTGGSVAMTGTNRSNALRSSTGGTITTNSTAISTSGTNSHAVLVVGSAPSSQVTINSGSVATSGTNSYGLFADNTGAIVNDNAARITTTGSVGFGIYAYGGGIANVTGGSIVTSGSNADGMLASGTDANNNAGRIIAAGVTVVTHGTQSVGIAAGNPGDSEIAGNIDFTGGSITTTGSQSAGVSAQLGASASLHNTTVSASGPGSAAVSVGSGARLNVGGSTLTSAQSAGIAITDDATVNLTGTTVKAGPSSASIVSTLDTAGQTQSITVGTGSTLTQNNGTLLQVNRTGGGIDGIVNLTLQAGSVATGNIVDTVTSGGTGKTNFDVQAGALWSGNTQGVNNTSVGEGGSLTYGAVGANAGHATAIAGDVSATNYTAVTFNTAATVGGSVASGNNSTVAFNQTATIGGGVTSGQSSAVAFNDAVTVNGTVQSGDNSTVAFKGAATVGGNVTSGGNSKVAFEQIATIGGNVTSGPNATVAFNNTAAVAGNVQGTGTTIVFAQGVSIGQNLATTGGSVTFDGAATIGKDISANNSTIVFSKSNPVTVNGNLVLDNGAVTSGGATGGNSQLVVAGDVSVNGGSKLGGNLSVIGKVSGNGIIVPSMASAPAPVHPSVNTTAVIAPLAAGKGAPFASARAVLRDAVPPASVSPGNSVATQTYGSLSGFTGTYMAGVNAAAQSDLVVVRSNVDLSQIKLVVGQENGTDGYRINTPYAVLQTTNGGTVQNKFASADLDASFDNTLLMLSPVKYDATAAIVSLMVDPAKVAVVRQSMTQNENAALTGAMSEAGPSLMVDALFTTAIKGSNFDQVSGESYASIKTALIQDSHYLRDMEINRLRSVFAPAVVDNADGRYVAGSAGNGSDLWATGFGARNHGKATDGAAELSASTSGTVVGVDKLLDNNWRIGGLVGYSQSNYHVDGLSSLASTDNYHVGMYGGTQASGFGVRLGAAYTWNSIKAQRAINFADFVDHTSSHYDSGVAQAFGEIGYPLQLRHVAFEPFANMAAVRLRTTSFSETGGGAALGSQGDEESIAFSALGLHASSNFDVGTSQLAVQGKLGWQHAFGAVNPMAALSFAGGQPFNVAGIPLMRDAALVEVGLNARLTKSSRVGFSYSGQLNGRAKEHGFTANLDYQF